MQKLLGIRKMVHTTATPTRLEWVSAIMKQNHLTSIIFKDGMGNYYSTNRKWYGWTALTIIKFTKFTKG